MAAYTSGQNAPEATAGGNDGAAVADPPAPADVDDDAELDEDDPNDEPDDPPWRN